MNFNRQLLFKFCQSTRSFTSHRPKLAQPSIRSTTKMPGLPQISLTPEESALCELLTSCARWIDQTNALASLEDIPGADESSRAWKREQDSKGTERDKVQLRVAGGWVRDKVSHRCHHLFESTFFTRSRRRAES